MSQNLSILSERIVEFGDRSEIVTALTKAGLPAYSSVENVLRYLLIRDPHVALNNMVSSHKYLERIATEYGIEEWNFLERTELVGEIIKKALQGIYPEDIRVTGFHVLKKAVAIAEGHHQDELPKEITPLVWNMEFLIKHLYQFIIVNRIADLIDTDKRKRLVLKQKFSPLQLVVSAICEVQEINTKSDLLVDEAQRMFGRSTLFPGINLHMLNSFINFRNASFAHRKAYEVSNKQLQRHALIMCRILNELCDLFQKIVPKVIVQIHHEEDFLNRTRIYYISEDEDFDENGEINSRKYDKNNRTWILKRCDYYHTSSPGRYSPGMPLYLLNANPDHEIMLDPEIYDARELSKWEALYGNYADTTANSEAD